MLGYHDKTIEISNIESGLLGMVDMFDSFWRCLAHKERARVEPEHQHQLYMSLIGPC